ncbi:kinetochore Sim4 complex subunit Fta4 [Geopyxis carbonaria]|nr:kinetochore Sim4 complex subunit Fta4 [Geopyxis carbonaria]
MAPPATPIHALKRNFLNSQIALLAHVPQPGASWHTQLPPADEHGDLTPAALRDAAIKLDLIAEKHSKLVYSAQLISHVAAQLDALYRDMTDGHDGAVAAEEAVLAAGVDLTDPANIDALPEAYPPAPGETASDADLERYAELRERLVRNAALLAAQREKNAYYRRLRELVAPFENPAESVQPNLVTSTGRIAEELDRLRVLASRVNIQITRMQGQLPAGVEGGGEVQDGRFDAEALKRLLD